MKQKIFSILFLAFMCACSDSPGNESGALNQDSIVPVGTYNLEEVTTTCLNLFDSTIEVDISDTEINIYSTNDGYGDLSATLSDDVFNGTGSNNDIDYACSGTMSINSRDIGEITGTCIFTSEGISIACYFLYEEEN